MQQSLALQELMLHNGWVTFKIHKLEVSTSRVVQPVPVNLLSQHTESYYCMYSTRTKCRVSQVIQPSHGPPGTLLVSNLQCIAPTYSHRVLLVLNQSHLFPVLQKCRVVAKRWRTEGWLLDYTTGTLMWDTTWPYVNLPTIICYSFHMVVSISALKQSLPVIGCREERFGTFQESRDGYSNIHSHLTK